MAVLTDIIRGIQSTVLTDQQVCLISVYMSKQYFLLVENKNSIRNQYQRDCLLKTFLFIIKSTLLPDAESMAALA